MGRVQEGAFDPGPPPPEPPKVEEPAPEQPKEDLREKCLRRLKEQEEREAKALDWYTSLSNGDPGDEAMLDALTTGRGVTTVGLDLSPSGADAMAMAMAVADPPIRLVSVSAEPTKHGWELRVDFVRRGAYHVATELIRSGRSPDETVYRLRQLADRIERDLSPMEPLLSRARSLKW